MYCRQASILLSFVILMLTAYSISARTLEKRDIRGGPPNEDVIVTKKRPFCNAFTGCGRKRSENNQANNALEPIVISEINGENEEDYLARLSRKIMAEARLWELLQQRLAELTGGFFSSEVFQVQPHTPVLDLLNSKRKRRSVPSV